MGGLRLIWLIPAGMLLLALAPLPYGYYTLLRLVVCGSGAFIAWMSTDDGFSVWTALFAVLALLFNPLIPVHLDREIWAFIDVGAVILFLVHWRRVEREKKRGSTSPVRAKD